MFLLNNCNSEVQCNLFPNKNHIHFFSKNVLSLSYWSLFMQRVLSDICNLVCRKKLSYKRKILP